jgi:hypothetical protein
MSNDFTPLLVGPAKCTPSWQTWWQLGEGFRPICAPTITDEMGAVFLHLTNA